MEPAKPLAAARASSGLIIITGGDPAGIGPELVRSLTPELQAAPEPIVYLCTAGPAQSAEVARLLDARYLPEPPAEWGPDLLPGPARCLVVSCATETARPGHPNRSSGAAAFRALEQACNLALEAPALATPCAGIVTAPLSKEWTGSSQPGFTGHTGYLAERFSRSVLMLMHGVDLSVVPLTIHIPLKAVSTALEQLLARPEELIPLFEQLQSQPSFRGARWALCGLNPHAGEGGLLGSEEVRFLESAARVWRAAGIPVDGPLPADAAFLVENRARYRLILGCYHDQVLTPFKALEGRRGINVTVGLPVVRSSPDHGTAYGIAGTGQADPESMRRALAYVQENAGADRPAL